MRSTFPTTRWTLVVRAADTDSTVRREALAELLSQNWYPLYVYLRRSGKPEQEIEDLIQGFYLRILETDMFSGVEQHHRGRFRNFLLVCLKNYLTNEWHRDQALKRGGGKRILSINLSDADKCFKYDPSHNLTPERAFDRAWAMGMIERSLQEIAQRWHEAGKGERFELLKVCLTQIDASPRKELAEKLGISTETLKVAVHRLRNEFRAALCRQVAETLGRDDLLEDEINLLFSSLTV